MQVDVFEHVHILPIFAWGKVRRNNGDLHAVWHLWYVLHVEWFWQVAILGLGTQRIQGVVQEVLVNGDAPRCWKVLGDVRKLL